MVNALLPLLKDENFWVRSSVADALGQLGTESEAVVDALLSLLKDEIDFVRSRAADALGQLGNAQNSISIPKHITIALDRWIEQNRESEYVSDGVRALWDIVSGETR